ncbi:5-carboxymethyl-2-hydroxymuconate Delta-isomerase [Aliiroseovarius marinus]|uniref:5-carboxymethyl-2-hydroxymuconate Delta-isomerase n=1 Tax=Aliiroseovarius marinus TaxID=2500159 RepID=UPI00105C14A3|nr:5-carboxymethyl-2-hydroxymuconate isomerase [Aliiroseovarius marinus]
MPHIRIEYTGEAETGMQPLCEALLDALSSHDAIPDPSSIKIRALPVAYAVLGTEAQSFAHAQFALLPGRSEAVKSDLAGLIVAIMRTHLPQIANLSVDVEDLSPSYAKDVL